MGMTRLLLCYARAVHATRYRFSGAEYDRLADIDFFFERRVELIDGEIVEMSAQTAPTSSWCAG